MGDHADALYLRAVDEIDEIREATPNARNLGASGMLLQHQRHWAGHCVCASNTKNNRPHIQRVPACPIHGDRLDAIAYRQEQLAEDDASHHADSERDE